MKVKVIAPFAVPGLGADECLEIAAGARVRDLPAPAGAARLYWSVLPVTVNGKQVDKAHELADGDVVIFVLPISGG